MGCTADQIRWNNSVWAVPFGAYSCSPDEAASADTSTQTQQEDTGFNKSNDQRVRFPGDVNWTVTFAKAKRFADKPNDYFRSGVLLTETERKPLACTDGQVAVKVKLGDHKYSEAMCEPIENIHVTGSPERDYAQQVSAR